MTDDARRWDGSCHCGAVQFTLHDAPERLVACNCSICRRIGALWFHTSTKRVSFAHPDAPTIAYAQGDRTLAVHSCQTCGCTTHYLPLDGTDRMAVNMRMADPIAIAGLRVRHFDGADTWAFLD